MIRIGSYELNTDVILAPLSGVSDLSFRLIAREHGARFCFHEMVDANSLVHEKAWKTEALLQTCPTDIPIAADGSFQADLGPLAVNVYEVNLPYTPSDAGPSDAGPSDAGADADDGAASAEAGADDGCGCRTAARTRASARVLLLAFGALACAAARRRRRMDRSGAACAPVARARHAT